MALDEAAYDTFCNCVKQIIPGPTFDLSRKFCEFVGDLDIPINCLDVTNSFAEDDHKACIGKIYLSFFTCK